MALILINAKTGISIFSSLDIRKEISSCKNANVPGLPGAGEPPPFSPINSGRKSGPNAFL